MGEGYARYTGILIPITPPLPTDLAVVTWWCSVHLQLLRHYRCQHTTQWPCPVLRAPAHSHSAHHCSAQQTQHSCSSHYMYQHSAIYSQSKCSQFTVILCSQSPVPATFKCSVCHHRISYPQVIRYKVHQYLTINDVKITSQTAHQWLLLNLQNVWL